MVIFTMADIFSLPLSQERVFTITLLCYHYHVFDKFQSG